MSSPYILFLKCSEIPFSLCYNTCLTDRETYVCQLKHQGIRCWKNKTKYKPVYNKSVFYKNFTKSQNSVISYREAEV